MQMKSMSPILFYDLSDDEQLVRGTLILLETTLIFSDYSLCYFFYSLVNYTSQNFISYAQQCNTPVLSHPNLSSFSYIGKIIPSFQLSCIFSVFQIVLISFHIASSSSFPPYFISSAAILSSPGALLLLVL